MYCCSSTFKTPPSCSVSCSLFTKPKRKPETEVIRIANNKTRLPFESLTSCRRTPEMAPTTKHRLQLLASEFRSLTEPIDRVKRLLDYAAVLPALDESARVQTNKVTGCTTQVWLEVVMDERGRMRFRADSDSEITKGFCSCLILALDGAEPEEVMGVKAEDLTEMNVGVHGKAVSRVNTWQNVLVGMQKRTHYLVTEREEAKFFSGCTCT
ncbi:hypothetical protein ACOSP7_018472 [Xanthoceras sorbifolium]|uniref:Fe-S metabolism associated domain-containing protein n=1 Tax=Xanthoceras sorbifolium TaxID=99658 RepID=A0ABQ8I177_9ROSI|nr:hypothetical protein JRO89_XS05G0095000 [Xanthoceras sorbifolium]